MKTLISYIVIILFFTAVIVLPKGGNKIKDYKYNLDYNMHDIKEVNRDSLDKSLDSLIDMSERNIKYLEYKLKSRR